MNKSLCPSHPGEILLDILEDIKLSQTELAKHLKVSRRTVNRLVNCKSPITIDLAIRLGICLGNGPELWLNLQQKFDLWNATQDMEIYNKIESINTK